MRSILAGLAFLLSLACVVGLGLFLWALISLTMAFRAIRPVEFVWDLLWQEWLILAALGGGTLVFFCLGASLMKYREP